MSGAPVHSRDDRLFLDRFALGHGARHDRRRLAFQCCITRTFYDIPQAEWPTLVNKMARAFWLQDSTTPFTLSELAQPTHRLFLDLDGNKDERLFTHDELEDFMYILQSAVSREFAYTTQFTKAQVGAGVRRGEDPGPWAWWFKETEQMRDDEDTRDDRAFNADAVDPYMCIVLKSVLRNEDGSQSAYCTYHLVWPFLIIPGNVAKTTFNTIFDKPNLQRFKARLKPDTEVCSRGTLRAFMNDNGERRPMRFDAVYGGSGNRLGRSEMLAVFGNPDEQRILTLIWRAVTILYPPAPEEGPAHGQDAIEDDAEERPPQPWSMEWARAQFLGPCNETYDPAMLKHVLSDAVFRLTQNPNTSEEQLLEGVEEAVVDYLNKFLCVVMFETRTTYIVRILNPDEGYNRYLHKGAMDVMSFLKAGGSHVAYLPGKKRAIKLDAFDLWNASPRRLFFTEMVFADPEKCRPGAFNIWRGYRISKDEARKYRGHRSEYRGKEFSIETCLEHIFNYFANKNEDVYWWLVEWLAQRLQRPFDRSCSVPILVSEEGIGKDLLLSDAMMAIIGKYHSLNTTSPEDIAGKFNAVLEGKIYVVYNEARSLDPIKADKLKSIVTDKNLRVEHKFVDAYTIDNMVNILIFSNGTSEKILDLSPQSRRYVHCLCNSSVNKQPQYFEGLSRWLGIADGQPVTENGIKCFADYLYSVNIADFNSRRIVITDSLVDQKLASMHPVHTWWHECLSTGKIGYHCLAGLPQRSPNALMHVNAEGIDTTFWGTNRLEVDKNDLWGVYRAWVLECGKKNKIGANSVFFKRLHLVLQFESRRPRMMDGMRGTYIIIPELPACKEMFGRFCTGATFYDTVPDGVGRRDDEVLPAPVKGDAEIRGLGPPRVDADVAPMAADD
eukprot:m51a1_g10622 hypothetical protein (893) ;mRNA; f:62931-65609